MQLRAALAAAIQRLTDAHVGSSRLNGETLLMFTLDVDRAHLYAHPERELTADEQQRYAAAIAERARGVPAQYITGHQEFWGLDLIVSPAVLIPRPETEHVVETVLALCEEKQVPRSGRDDKQAELRIADVGAGSGCIALALASELPHALIFALDNSAAALEVARANAARHQLSQHIEFRENDLLTGISGTFDFIVSNPPYVPEREADTVEAQVRRFEPHTAVFGGEDGLDVYSRLIPQAHAALARDGWLVMEIGQSVEAGVRTLLTAWRELRVIPDLQQIPRVVAARK